MNGASGFREVWSSTSRSSTNRLLREQRHRFETGAWHLLRTHDLFGLSTGICTKREQVPDIMFMPKAFPDSTPLTLSVLDVSYVLLFSNFEQENIPRLGFPLP